MDKNKRSILYVNFSPYENAGNILDYLQANFYRVAVFSFRFHNIKGNSAADALTVYENGAQVSRTHLVGAPVVSTMTFFLLPVRSLIILIQLFLNCLTLRKSFGQFDVYFTVNAYTAWLGSILRATGIVRKTVFWVWDYYPPVHTDPIVRTMRWIYWQFDKTAATRSNRTVFLNGRLAELRRKLNLLPSNRTYPVVPIGTNPIHVLPSRSHAYLKLVFFGVLKKSQGLDAVFAAAPDIVRAFPKTQLHIIGNGPDKEYFRSLADTSPLKTTFYGFVEKEEDIQKIIKTCDVGLAPYVPDVSNVSYYTDPSKIKVYLSQGVPTIMTDFLTFSQVLTKARAGVVIHNLTSKSLMKALISVMKDHTRYRNNALKLGKRFAYTKIYPQLFSDIYPK